ncbi:MAG TPA: thioredoxin [Syntrophomonadaceae bacterium]|nr:thioredoxin [Syntrophomonadaceae bacterium]HQA06540.1 thioredoxin [Syntrophomonadaceae bacterium]HQE22479.1 thioredoxin [Syntrophomonadaceae bacterium]
MAEVKTLTNDNFDQEVKQSTLPVLVDFWAPWCGPCKMVGPVVESLAADYEGKLKVGKVNVDENKELAAQFGIRGIPTLVIFKDGNEAQRVVGAQGKAQLQKMIDQFI